jgi:hypothetical protein
MTTEIHHAASILRWAVTLLFVLLLPSVTRGSNAGFVRWSVRLSPDNPDYIEVFVDATSLPSNLIIKSASLSVAFHDAQDRVIKNQGFEFLDRKLVALRPDKYLRRFKHSCPNAIWAEGIDFAGYGAGGGGKADTAPLFREHAAAWRNDALREQPRVLDRLPQLRESARREIGIQVVVHLQDIGDQSFRNNEFAGTRGESRRLEGFQLRIDPPVEGLSLRYMAHLQDIGDVPFVNEGELVGTSGESRRLEGFAIELTGPAADKYDVLYMAHVEGIGDTGFFKNGEFCGTRGESRRIEGILVRIVPH